MDIESAEAIKYLGVEISRKGVTQLAGARIVSFIPRDEIRELHLKHGFSGERRWLQLGLGTIFLGWAALQILSLVLWLINGGIQSTGNIVVVFILIGVGGWLTWDATHRQWYIEVHTQEKIRKLAFDGKVDTASLRTFLKFSRQMGYPMDATLLDVMDQK